MALNARKVIEKLSRGIILRRRLPERFGRLPIFVSPESALSYWKALSDDKFSDLFAFADEFVTAGDTVWDVGANVGVFTFCAAYKVGQSGRILSLDADSWSAGLLRRSARRNRDRLGNVDVLQVALMDRLSIEAFNIPERGRASSHLRAAGGAGEEITGSVRETCLVPTVTLDWLTERYPAPDVVKIDVDGAEWMVLQGGAKLLDGKKPVLLLEVYERNADNVSTFLRGLGYRLFDWDNRAERRPIARAVYNTLALPCGRQA